MNSDRYIRTLEKKNDELQKKLAEEELLREDIRKNTFILYEIYGNTSGPLEFINPSVICSKLDLKQFIDNLMYSLTLIGSGQVTFLGYQLTKPNSVVYNGHTMNTHNTQQTYWFNKDFELIEGFEFISGKWEYARTGNAQLFDTDLLTYLGLWYK